MNDAAPASSPPPGHYSHHLEDEKAVAAIVVTPARIYSWTDDAGSSVSEHRRRDDDDDDDDVALAAHRLCQLKASSPPVGFLHFRDEEGSDQEDDDCGDREGDVGFSLAEDDDEANVNPLHRFVRREAVEYFVIGRDGGAEGDDGDEGDEDHRDAAGSKREYPGRVGLRCKFCPRPSKQRRRRRDDEKNSNDDNDDGGLPPTKMSTVLPASLANLYRAVCRFQTTHFLHCPHVPSEMKETYRRLKEEEKTRGNKRYWVTSARRKGLGDHPVPGREGIVLSGRGGEGPSLPEL